MAEVAPTAAHAPTKAPKKRVAKPKKAGPSVGELIVKAVSSSTERSGVSLSALKKVLSAGGYDVERNNSRVKLAVKGLVQKGTLLQTKGTGASGSFKLNKKQAEPKKKTAPKKKPAAKKPAAAKKPKAAGAKKPAAKKATKSPRKAKKPAAPKRKAAKSPKKAKAAKPKTAKPKAAKPKKAAHKK